MIQKSYETSQILPSDVTFSNLEVLNKHKHIFADAIIDYKTPKSWGLEVSQIFDPGCPTSISKTKEICIGKSKPWTSSQRRTCNPTTASNLFIFVILVSCSLSLEISNKDILYYTCWHQLKSFHITKKGSRSKDRRWRPLTGFVQCWGKYFFITFDNNLTHCQNHDTLIFEKI